MTDPAARTWHCDYLMGQPDDAMPQWYMAAFAEEALNPAQEEKDG